MTNVGPLQRQWNLLRLLSARRRGMTVQEMAQEASVSVKTVRRDLQTLSLAGFPLDETTEAHGLKRWMVQEGHRQSQMNFTLTEAASLFLGRQFLEPLAGTMLWDGARSAFRKIRSTLGESTVAYLEKVAAEFHQTAVGASDYSRKSEIIDQLMIGIEDRRSTFLTYQSASATEPVTYDVYPYGLVYHRGSLYLVAFSTDRNEIRHYKVDRIEDAEVTDLRFTPPQDFDLQSHLANSFGVFKGNGEPIRVLVEFAPRVARYVEESHWHESQKLTKQDDGRLLAAFELADTEEIKRWVLSFGMHATVLEPEDLRAEIDEEIRWMGENYDGIATDKAP